MFNCNFKNNTKKELINLYINIYNDKPYNKNLTYNIASNHINKWKETGQLIVVISSGKIIGFLGGYYLNNNKTSFYLDKICVDVSYRNRGIGTSLINTSKQICQNIFLRVNTLDLINFYKKWDFFYTGIKINDRFYLYSSN